MAILQSCRPTCNRDLINVAQLTAQYYVLKPEAGNAEHAVKFGTSGHRGSAARHSFNEPHILAIAQAIAEERAKTASLALLWGKDTTPCPSLRSFPYWKCWQRTALMSLCRKTMASLRHLPFPMPFWFTIKKGGPLADGIVITPSHNPPEDGGIKYNPPNGGPADTNVTKVVEDRANALLADGLKGVKRISLDEAMASGHVKRGSSAVCGAWHDGRYRYMAAIQKAG